MKKFTKIYFAILGSFIVTASTYAGGADIIIKNRTSSNQVQVDGLPVVVNPMHDSGTINIVKSVTVRPIAGHPRDVPPYTIDVIDTGKACHSTSGGVDGWYIQLGKNAENKVCSVGFHGRSFHTLTYVTVEDSGDASKPFKATLTPQHCSDLNPAPKHDQVQKVL